MTDNQNPSGKIIGVHTLSEFVYCSRAGIISYQQKKDDAGIEDGFADLTYMPDYDIVLAKQEIVRIVRRLESFAFGLLGGSLATVILAVAVKPFLGFLCLLLLVPSALFFARRIYQDFKRFFRLKATIAAYNSQVEQRPDLSNPKTELISWYSLLKSFDVEKCHDQLIDHEMGVAGRPWKLLHRGDVCMPVFFCRKPASAGEKNRDPISWLFPQHFVRMRAYCHLVEKNTGTHSPCGIIVFAGTMKAVAIKFWNNEGANHQFEEALFLARQTLNEFEQFDSVGVPSPKTCVRCHLGKPRTYRLSGRTVIRNGSSVKPTLHRIVTGEKTTTYHSTCGDFFRWIPPHEKAAELGLDMTADSPRGDGKESKPSVEANS